MNRTVFLALLFSFVMTGQATAQIGFNGSYRFNKANDWVLSAGSSPQIELLGEGPAFGVDYWFRLKNYRIEFLPELNIGLYKADLGQNITTKVGLASLFFNTHFYLFDMKGDCDCPTFSKQGPKLEKGFYLELSPGLSWIHKKVVDAEGSEPEALQHKSFSPSIGIGAGLDIGISDLVTVTPHIGYRYYPSVAWSGLSGITSLFEETYTLSSETTAISQLYAGLRLGLRLDYRQKGFKRR